MTVMRRIRAVPSWQVTLGVALLALGFLIAAQLASEGPRVQYTTQERTPLVETANELQTQQDDLKARILDLRSKIQTIEKAKTYPTKPGVLCGWCEYLTVCSDGQAAVANRKKRAEAKEAASGKVPKALASSPVLAITSDQGAPAPPLAERPSAALAAVAPAALPVPTGKRKRAVVVSPDQLSLFN